MEVFLEKVYCSNCDDDEGPFYRWEELLYGTYHLYCKKCHEKFLKQVNIIEQNQEVRRNCPSCKGTGYIYCDMNDNGVSKMKTCSNCGDLELE